MALREELLRRIDKKKKEISAMTARIKEAEIYIEVLEETLELVPSDGNESVEPPAANLREGSSIAKAREAIQRAGKPLHISELLTAMGKPVDSETRASIAGSLGTYARKKEIFIRTGPNTFGLIEMQNGNGKNNQTPVSMPRPSILKEPPPTFGMDEPLPDEATSDEVPF
jgi:hypothetical protein